jgi:hypothetical protein
VTEVLVTLLRVPAPDAGEIVQLTPLLAGSGVTVAVNDCGGPPVCTVAVAGSTETTSVGTLMVAEADFDVSAMDVAVMVTVRWVAGGVTGGLYVTELGVISIRLPAPEAGEMVQVTPWPDGSLFALALNVTPMPPACTVTLVGSIETVIAGTVTVAESDFDVSAADAALTITLRSLAGALAGAE